MWTGANGSTWLAWSVRASTRGSRSSASSLDGSSMTAAARGSRARRSFVFSGKSLCGLGKTAFEEAGDGSPDRPRMNARGIADGRLIYPAAIPEIDRDFDHLVRSRSRSHRPPETGFHRSEERRVGKECVSTCRFRWLPYH